MSKSLSKLTIGFKTKYLTVLKLGDAPDEYWCRCSLCGSTKLFHRRKLFKARACGCKRRGTKDAQRAAFTKVLQGYKDAAKNEI